MHQALGWISLTIISIALGYALTSTLAATLSTSPAQDEVTFVAVTARTCSPTTGSLGWLLYETATECRP